MIEHKMESTDTWCTHYLLRNSEHTPEVFRSFLEQFEKSYERKNDHELGSGGDIEYRETDDPESNIELAKELDRYQEIYMYPPFYEKLEGRLALLRGVCPGDVVGPNCLAFALKMPVRLDGKALDTKPYPGYYADLDFPYSLMDAIRSGNQIAAKKEMAGLIGQDVQAMGGELIEVDKDYRCNEGEYKICMMASSDMEDYHFMREGDHAWFHKRGITSVSCFDDAQKLITDPEHCKTNYEQFLGYYVVRGTNGKENI